MNELAVLFLESKQRYDAAVSQLIADAPRGHRQLLRKGISLCYLQLLILNGMERSMLEMLSEKINKLKALKDLSKPLSDDDYQSLVKTQVELSVISRELRKVSKSKENTVDHLNKWAVQVDLV